MHAALPAEIGTTLIQKMKCLRRGERRPEGADFAPLRIKKPTKFRQHFRVFEVLFSKIRLLVCLQCCPKITNVDENFRNFSSLYGKYQNFLHVDFQIS